MGVQSQSASIQRDSTDTSPTGITLLNGETVIESVSPSRWNWAKLVLLSVGIGVLGIQTVAVGEVTAGLIAVALGSVVTTSAYFSHERSEYIVTDQRVIKNVGIVRTGSEDIRIADVRGVSVTRSLRQRFMRTATVTVESIGGDGAIEMRNACNHETLAGAIRAQQQTVEETIGPENISVTVDDER